MKKALILVGDGFEDAELLYPYYRLQEEGFEVDVVGSEAGKIFTGKRGYPMKSNTAAKEVKIDDYAVLQARRMCSAESVPKRLRRSLREETSYRR